HQGARAARGEWLLFTDADTWHAPDSAASAVAWALASGADGLTLFPAFEPRSVIEAAALAVAFAGLFAGMRSPEGLVNGQYLLVRREAYERIGGFAAVRDQMLEDLAIGMRLRSSGYQIPLLDGRDAFRVRMYAGIRSMWDGMSRLSAGTLGWPGLRPWIAMFLIASLALPLRGVGGWHRGPWWAAWIEWMASGVAMLPWSSRMGRPEAALIAPLGAAFVAAAGLRGLLWRWIGAGIPWKERRVR
ncbi:MAG: glycosyltransferase, partial [Thermoflexus sp.]|nr:glycosyltransferase [Thermoflexus sp.]